MQTTRKNNNANIARLLIAQAQVSFNDNAAKLSLIGLAHLVLARAAVDGAVGAMAALLVLPFILFSPVFGWLADRFPKTLVLRHTLAIQIAGTGLLAGAVALHRFDLAAGCFFLLAVQAAAFSPAKQGIIKELCNEGRLNQAVSWIESSTIIAILTGGFAGGLLLDGLTSKTGSAWTGAAWTIVLLTGGCVASWFVFRRVPVMPAQSREPFRPALLVEHFSYLRRLGSQRPLLAAASGIAWFYGVGGFLYLVLVQAGRESHPGVGAASTAGWFLTLLGGGIIAGALLYAQVSRSKMELRALPFSVAAMAVLMFAASVLPPAGILFQIALFLTGLAGGTFTIPLNAFLQDRSENQERGRMISACNLLTNITAMAAVGLQFVLTDIFKLDAAAELRCVALTAVAAAAVAAWIQPELLLRLLAGVITRIFYRVRVSGAGNLPRAGGVLLVSNHVTYVDALLLGTRCSRNVRFLAFDEFFKVPVLGSILRHSGSIPISSRRPKEALARAVELLEQGEVVCIFPEGELTRSGEVMGFRRGFEIIARRSGAPVVPVHLGSFWGSIFSFSGGKYFRKLPPELPRRVGISFGPALNPESVTAFGARQAVLALETESFSSRRDLQDTIGNAALKRLSAKPWETLITDCASEVKRATCGEVLAAALVLSARWRREIPERRVGLLLPPGRAGVIANLAVVLAGKIPVNLNPSASRESATASMATAGIGTIITASKVRSRFPSFPLPTSVLEVEGIFGTLPKLRLALCLAAAWILPSRMLAAVFRIPCRISQAEAVLLFTSGSSGDPKGVALTHANILANIAQVSTTGLIQRDDRVLGCLPLFHSFGSTFGLWLPLLCDIGLVSTPSPLDAAGVGSAAAEGKATVLLGTPTFLRSYARKVTPEQFATLRFAMAGAEKLPVDLADLWRGKYGTEILEGYGLTETSPVLAANLPNPLQGPGADSVQICHRPGSVGRLMPGVSFRLTDPETGGPVPEGSAGLLAVRGANVFTGYLNAPARTAEVLKDGWFTTGDLARVDEDGFVFIEGRLSRFAKIGGEMVPLGKVEEVIITSLSLKAARGPAIALVAAPHPTKGERTVLLTVMPIEKDVLREKLTAAGLPNLWIPGTVCVVPEIPILATGKTDWQACKRIAEAQS